MKQIALPLLILVLLGPLSLIAQQEMQDVVYLKDGSVIRGIIVEQVPGVSLKIKTRDSNVFVYKIADVQKMTKETSTDARELRGRGEKSPILALGLSLLVPGGGQYYNGQNVKGAIMTIVSAGGAVVMVTGDHHEAPYGLLVYAVAAVWSLIDAPIATNLINQERENSYGHLLELKTRVGLAGMDLAVSSSGVGAKIVLHF
ncbi:MAG: hypothetical protein NTU47_05210 [Ignavibacteriales bacterium]|nr:hypothetical protein [Ignavibacteriales bacterium]